MALTIRMRIDDNDEHSYYYATGSGEEINLQNKSASYSSNGNYTIQADSGYDGLGTVSVAVSVPNTYSSGDNGKVVSNGALVAQTAHADVTPSTSDQTINTTLNNSIKVKGDADLVAGNIKKDVEIFGVTGSYEGGGGGVSNVDVGEFDTGLMTEGASNALFQLRANESPIAIYIFSIDPMMVSTPSSEGLISFSGVVDQSSGIPFDCYIGQSYFDGSSGQYNGYAKTGNLTNSAVDGSTEMDVIGESNNSIYGWVTDMNNPSGFGLLGMYQYVVIYPNK